MPHHAAWMKHCLTSTINSRAVRSAKGYASGILSKECFHGGSSRILNYRSLNQSTTEAKSIPPCFVSVRIRKPPDENAVRLASLLYAYCRITCEAITKLEAVWEPLDLSSTST